jgi:hypothetical protein
VRSWRGALLLAVVLGPLSAGRAEAGPISFGLDFGPDRPQRQRVQAGFQEFSITPDNNTVPVPRGPGVAKNYTVDGFGVQVTLNASSGNRNASPDLIARDRGAINGPQAFTYSDLVRDFVGSVNPTNSSPVLTLYVDGLTPNYEYRAYLWSYDAAARANNEQRIDWFLNDAAQPFEKWAYNTGLPPQRNLDGRIAFSTVFDLRNGRKVTFTGKYVSGSQIEVPLNGIEFIPIRALPTPEPSTLLLGGIAAAISVGGSSRRRVRLPRIGVPW